MFPFIARCATNGSTDLSSGTVTDWENVTGCTYANTALNERRPMAEDEGPARVGRRPRKAIGASKAAAAARIARNTENKDAESPMEDSLDADNGN